MTLNEAEVLAEEGRGRHRDESWWHPVPGREIQAGKRHLLRASSIILAAVSVVVIATAISQIPSPKQGLSNNALSDYNGPAIAASSLPSGPGASTYNLSLKAKARTTELYRSTRGSFDPRTGLTLLQCSDTVSFGAWGRYTSLRESYAACLISVSPS